MKIIYKGKQIARHYGAFSLEEAMELASDFSGEQADASFLRLAPESVDEKRSIVRSDIKQNVGDVESVVGTTTDGMHLLLHEFSKLVVKLNHAESLSDVRNATQDFFPFAESLLKNESNGNLKFPYRLKGEQNVMRDIEERASSVSMAIEKARNI